MKKFFLFSVLFISGSAYSQVNLTLGLKAYYPFSGNANDLSGNNNNPVFNNALLTTDRFGNLNSAYQFNGINNYIRIPNSSTLNFGNKVSFCAWVKAQGFFQGPCHGNSIFEKGEGSFANGHYFLRFDDNFWTNGANCTNPVPDIVHQNFYGPYAGLPSPGYSPYVTNGQWMSVIYTYDGINIKLYINCELKISQAVNGINFTNNFDLFLGHLNNPSYPYWFNGVMDELRFYDRAINQDEVNVLGGCTSGTGISNIINEYTPIIALNPCTNKITVEDATKFNPGDTVLMIQMKGAVIDSTNSSSFGNITDYKNSGNYEFNYVKAKAGNIIELKNKLTRQYDIPTGKVQLIRIPYYNSASVNNTLTCLPWDGNKGGVLAFNVKDTDTLNADIDVTGKGFRGGNTSNTGNAVLSCYQDAYYLDSASLASSRKGEGITNVGTDKLNGRGHLANGGGGGNGHNSGGGGGSNAAVGGFGGYQLFECNNSNYDNKGIGGIPLTYSNTANKIFLGGGGGAGHKDGLPTQTLSSAGGDGGGIVIVTTKYLKSNAHSILSDGAHGKQCDLDGFTCLHDGMGGGGGGGSVLLNVTNYIDNHKEIVTGGKGADLILFTNAAGHVAPGGGGGAGVVWFSSAALPANATVTNAGGINGVIVLDSNNPFGSTAGQNGFNLFSLKIPIDTSLFRKNIDSVRIKDSSTACLAFDFKGSGYTNTNPVATWNWDFGDAGTSNTQNASHTYAVAGTYTVKLIVTDINGCKDSITKNIISNTLSVDAGNDSTLCNGPVTFQLHGSGTGNFLWSPGIYLNSNTLQNPTATISATTIFYLTVTTLTGCTGKDSVTIKFNTASSLVQPPNKSFCSKDTVRLDGGNGNAVQYLWSPPTWLSNTTSINPLTNPPASTTYTVKITDTGCNFDSTFTVLVTERPLPFVTASSSNDIDCSLRNARLTVSGALQYLWVPPATLNSSNNANPVATPTITTQYVVTGTDNYGCKNKDSVTVLVKDGLSGYDIPNSFTPNGDGINDCFGIKHWGNAQNVIFIIYSRWGEKVFETNNVNNCWNGTYKGKPANIGNYVYYASGRTACGDLVMKGNVLLLR